MTTSRLTDEQIAELERLDREATRGPWAKFHWGAMYAPRSPPLTLARADAELASAARNALPSLLSEVRASRAAATTGDPSEEYLRGYRDGWATRRPAAGDCPVPPPGSAAPDAASERLARCHHDDHTLPSLPAGSAAREDGGGEAAEPMVEVPDWIPDDHAGATKAVRECASEIAFQFLRARVELRLPATKESHGDPSGTAAASDGGSAIPGSAGRGAEEDRGGGRGGHRLGSAVRQRCPARAAQGPEAEEVASAAREDGAPDPELCRCGHARGGHGPVYRDNRKILDLACWARTPDGGHCCPCDRYDAAAPAPGDAPATAAEPTGSAKLRARLDAMTDEERAGVMRRLAALSAEVQDRDARGLCDECDGPGAEPDTASEVRLCPACRASPPSSVEAHATNSSNEEGA